MTTAPEDPVVEQIREVRRELQERFGGDVDALCDFLSQREAAHPERLVNRPAQAAQEMATSASKHPSDR